MTVDFYLNPDEVPRISDVPAVRDLQPAWAYHH